jgi:hypothetical protein
MPVEIYDCDDGLGHYIVVRGAASVEEYVDAFKRHLEQDEEKFKKYMFCLCDYRGIKQFDLSSPMVQQLADMSVRAMEINSDAIVALVADQDLYFGLSRMFEALVFDKGWETYVFRSKEKALDWIRERVKEKFGIDNLTFN